MTGWKIPQTVAQLRGNCRHGVASQARDTPSTQNPLTPTTLLTLSAIRRGQRWNCDDRAVIIWLAYTFPSLLNLPWHGWFICSVQCDRDRVLVLDKPAAVRPVRVIRKADNCWFRRLLPQFRCFASTATWNIKYSDRRPLGNVADQSHSLKFPK